MKIGIVRETAPGERRVCATPETVKRFLGLGLEVAVETGAGTGAAIPDGAFAEAGAELVDGAEALYGQVDAVFRAAPPSSEELGRMRPGTLLIGILGPRSDPDRVAAYAERKLTALALELLPRITRAQSMDVLSSQSSVAGYGAVLLAAEAYPRLFPMLMTAAGTIPPARVLVLGAGVAGLQAIATARRLGAAVIGYDVRPAAREQVESLGAKFLAVESDETAGAETAGGYAKEMSDDYKAREQEMLAAEVARAGVVVTTALIPGRPAPRLITTEMVEAMAPGSVIVDLAAEAGGNCAATRPGETVTHGGVTVIGLTGLPSRWPADSSRLLARNLLDFVTPMVDQDTKAIGIDMDDEVVAACLLTRDGHRVHPDFGGPEGPPAQAPPEAD
jgi:NAD(P) transhydrogenase subunit alpha